jgi:ABC-type bacteriocin/lantibiotic exporter with double-glycine peptidase domain
MRCKECGSKQLVKNGSKNGNPYYKCKECNKQFSPRALYSSVLYATQDTFLLKGSLRENIFLFDKFSEQEFDYVIRVCCLQDFVAEYGKERDIAQDSQNISGGQLQRICLARTLIRRPSVLLLDEPTSALDASTTSTLVSNLSEHISQHKTTLICVTHDADFAKLGDRVVNVA